MKLAEKHGIKYTTLRERINELGWEPERAATKPLTDKRKIMAEIAKTRRIYPAEQVERAKANGISYITFYTRINKYGWSAEDAMTVPVIKGKKNKKVVSA